MHQSIQRPFGINVFGSAALQVVPDFAAVSLAVTRTAEAPGEAFRAAREAAKEVRSALLGLKVAAADLQTSRALLRSVTPTREEPTTRHVGSVNFSVVLRELDKLEELLTSSVEAGADSIREVKLSTSRLAEHRREARQSAFGAARRKAEAYAEFADVRLGEVVHIEDIDPDAVGGRRGHGELLGGLLADGAPADPGNIEVTAAVMVAFAIDARPGTSGFGS